MKHPLFSNDMFSRSTDLAPQQLINCVVFSSPSSTRSATPIVQRPGTSDLVTLAAANVRGMARSKDGTELYVVSGNKFYELNTSFTATERGTLSSSTGVVDIAVGEDNVGIKNTASTDGYEFIPSSNTFATVVDADFPNLVSLTYQDTYFIGAESGTGRIWVSENDDFSAWDALDFATEESQPDDSLQVISVKRNLWILGNTTAAPWYNSGDTFPFDRASFNEKGIVSSHAAAKIGEKLYWISKNESAIAEVVMSQGYDAVSISGEGINYKLSTLTLTDAEAYPFHLDGNDFLLWELPTSNLTLVYNATTRTWSQWQNSAAGRFAMRGCTEFAGRIVFGDAASGKIKSLSFGNVDDSGTDFNWTIVAPTLYVDNKRIFLYRAELDFEAGGGAFNTTLQASDNGGNTFTNHGTQAAGTVTDAKMEWTGLGSGNMWTIKLTGASDTTWRFFNLQLEFEVGGL